MTAAAGSWQDALLDAAVMAPRELPRARSVLALLARFAAGQGVPASPQWLLDYDVVEAFCVRGCAGLASSTRGTYRSVLYQLARRCTARRGSGRRRSRAPGHRLRTPRRSGRSWPRSRPPSVTRRNGPRRWRWWCSASGRGCGPASWRRCAAATSAGRGRQVVVHVSAGAGRVVPVAARYAGRAAELARRAGGGFVFRPGPADRGYKNFVTGFAGSLAAGPAAPRLSMSRARAAFICDHLAAGTPVPRAAGDQRDRRGRIAGPLRPPRRRASAHPRAPCGPAGARSARDERQRPDPAAAGGGISDETVAFAAALIDRSGKAPVIEAALAHPTGRPRPLPVRAVLTALVCLALDDRPLFLTEATRLLFSRTSDASRALLGRHRHRPRPPRFPGRLPAGPLLLPRHLLGHGPLAAAEKPAAERSRTSPPAPGR